MRLVAIGRSAHHVAQRATATQNDQSAKVLLLGDIRTAFDAAATDKLSTEDMVERLVGLEDRPWAEWKGGNPISKAALSRMLSTFKIYSGSIRLPDGRTPKGFYRTSFEDSFARYLPQSDATTPQAKSRGRSGDLQFATSLSSVAHPEPPQLNGSQECGVVAFCALVFQTDEVLQQEHVPEEGAE